jgi:hypothetical protein
VHPRSSPEFQAITIGGEYSIGYETGQTG